MRVHPARLTTRGFHHRVLQLAVHRAHHARATLSIAQREFVEASRSLGASNGRIIFREILPNLVGPVIVFSTLVIPANVLFEAYLSFLGLGIPEKIPSWGGMISSATSLYDVRPFLMIFPGLFLLFTTLAFNLLGDGLRDALDPRTSRA